MWKCVLLFSMQCYNIKETCFFIYQCKRLCNKWLLLTTLIVCSSVGNKPQVWTHQIKRMRHVTGTSGVRKTVSSTCHKTESDKNLIITMSSVTYQCDSMNYQPYSHAVIFPTGSRSLLKNLTIHYRKLTCAPSVGR